MVARTVLNFALPQFQGYPYINYLKTAVSQASSGGYAFPAALTANQYPKDGASISTTTFSSLTVPSDYTGDWIVDWQGQVGSGGVAGRQIARRCSGLTNISGPG